MYKCKIFNIYFKTIVLVFFLCFILIYSKSEAIETVNIELTEGWNLISLAVNPDDNQLKSLFPDASNAYSYSGSYQKADKLEPGIGYWIKVPTNRTYTITGENFLNYSITLLPGRYLLGTVNCDVVTPRVYPINALSFIVGVQNNRYTDTLELFKNQGYFVVVEKKCNFSITACEYSPVTKPEIDIYWSATLKAESKNGSNFLMDNFVEIGIGVDSLKRKHFSSFYNAVDIYIMSSSYEHLRKHIVEETEEEFSWIIGINPKVNVSSPPNTQYTATVSWNSSEFDKGKWTMKRINFSNDGFEIDNEAIAVDDMLKTTFFQFTGIDKYYYFIVQFSPTPIINKILQTQTIEGTTNVCIYGRYFKEGFTLLHNEKPIYDYESSTSQILFVINEIIKKPATFLLTLPTGQQSQKDTTFEHFTINNFTKEQLNEAVFIERQRWDINNNNIIGIEEAINALKISSKIKK